MGLFISLDKSSWPSLEVGWTKFEAKSYPQSYRMSSFILAATLAAIGLAIGIGIQNFPEGAAVSIPLRQEGVSRNKAFLLGQASGLVEPVSGVLGALLVISVSQVLPYALAFAAGAMIYVVVEELIPEAQQKQTPKGAHYATFGVMVGFIIMMMLDVALG